MFIGGYTLSIFLCGFSNKVFLKFHCGESYYSLFGRSDDEVQAKQIPPLLGALKLKFDHCFLGNPGSKGLQS